MVVCTPSTLDVHVKTALQQGSPQDHQIEIWDLPEPNLDGLHKSPSARDEERLSLLKREAAVCLQASQKANLIVYNLFSLEGHFIANHLGIPCIAASPHLQMRYAPLIRNSRRTPRPPYQQHEQKRLLISLKN